MCDREGRIVRNCPLVRFLGALEAARANLRFTLKVRLEGRE
jgi:hypothetical protein